jgi:chemotaxis protein CheC
MSKTFDLNEDQRDCLQELMNVSYGSATAAISEVLDSFATLNIPEIRFLPSSELESYFANQVNITYPKIFSSQLINGKLSGENIFVIDVKSANNITKILNEEEEVNEDDMLDVILEITNILSSSTTSKCAELLSTEVSFSSPSIQIINSVDKLDNTFIDNYDQVIIVSTELKFDSFDIHGELLILTKDASIVWLKESLDRVLEEL